MASANSEIFEDAESGDMMTGERLNIMYLTEKLVKRVFRLLNGIDLARAREVCRKWNQFASDVLLWKALCWQKCRALESDEHLWPLLCGEVSQDDESMARSLSHR